MNRYLIVICLFFGFHQAAGQECNMVAAGKILDESRAPLPNAAVHLEETDARALADTQGDFTLRGLCAGTYTLHITFLGYEDQYIRLRVPQDRPLAIRLRPSDTLLEGITIEEERGDHGRTQTTATLEGDDLDALHGKPLGESLKEVPGVSALQTGPSIFKPVIDGLHSQRILILNNGIRQEGQQWGVEHAPEVDPFIASQIKVVKGAETVRFGAAAMGGVILINPPPLHQTEKIGGEVNLGVMSNNRMGVFSGLVEGTISEGSSWSWRLQSSVKKGGDYHAPRYNLSNTGLNELNFSGALGYRDERKGLEVYLSSFNTEIGILRAAHTGNLDDLERSIESGRPWYERAFGYTIGPPRQKINHHLLKLSAYRQVSNLGKINVLYGGQYDHRNEFDIRRAGRNARPSIALKLLSHVVDISLDHESDAHSGSIGINGTIKDNSNDTEETGVRPLLPDFQQYSAGLFVLEKLTAGKWILEAGARYDFQNLRVYTFIDNTALVKPRFDFNFLSGTLGATILFNPSVRLLSNFGISSRPPHVSELYSEGLHHGTASIEEGLMRKDGNLLTEGSLIKMELSKKWINTLQYTGERLSADISLYYNNINNYVYIRPTGTRLTVRGYFPVFQYEQTDAVLTGSDVTLKWKVSERLTVNSKLSYIYAKDKSNDDVLIFIPPAQFENGVTYSLETFGKLRDFFAGLSLPATMRQVRAPRVISPSDIGEEPIQGTFDFAPAPDGYILVNAKVGAKFPVGEHFIGVNFTAENLLNTSYRNYMNRLRYFSEDIGSNFILRLSYNFLSH